MGYNNCKKLFIILFYIKKLGEKKTITGIKNGAIIRLFNTEEIMNDFDKIISFYFDMEKFK